MKIDMKVHTFFDRPKVTKSVDRTKVRALSKIGAFIRRTARTLLRRKATKRTSVSLPGEPPRQHTGLLRNHVFFAYDRINESVVIGPEKLNKPTNAPEVLEYGGRTKINGQTVTIKARPFMGPSYEENEPKIPEIFENSVRS
jgi:hypothetical protein